MSSAPLELGLEAGNLRRRSKVNSILGRFWFVLPALFTSFLKKLLPPQPFFLPVRASMPSPASVRGSIRRNKSSQVSITSVATSNDQS